MTDRIRSARPADAWQDIGGHAAAAAHARCRRPTPVRSNRRQRRPSSRVRRRARPSRQSPRNPRRRPSRRRHSRSSSRRKQPQLIFSPWVKLCNKDPDPNSKRVCVTVKDGRVESGLLVVSVAIIEMDGDQRKLMRMSLPYGVALTHGTRMIVDQGTPATAPFVTCLPPVVPPGGCIADYEATVDTINRMKKGQLLTVQAIHMNGQPMSPQLELKDFAKAYDGPPTDPKVFEEQQKKLQDELQKRAEDARKRLESQQK